MVCRHLQQKLLTRQKNHLIHNGAVTGTDAPSMRCVQCGERSSEPGLVGALMVGALMLGNERAYYAPVHYALPNGSSPGQSCPVQLSRNVPPQFAGPAPAESQ